MPHEFPFDVFQSTHSWALQTRLKLWANEETGSTNTIAKNDTDPATKPWLDRSRSEEVSEPTLYLASRQTQGRGRGSNSWVTPLGGALLSSWSFAVARVPQPILAPLIGLALFNATRRTWPEAPLNLKAPNDLYLGEKKVAGLLIETIDEGQYRRTVVGLGLNVFTSPIDIPTATHLNAHVPTLLSEQKWTEFLNTWIIELKSALLAGQNDRLNDSHTASLKEALNLHPLLKEPILRVDEWGQLHTPSRLIAWHEL